MELENIGLLYPTNTSQNELRKRNHKNAGFTLIEVALVLAVIAILVVVTAPKYSVLMKHYRLESSALKVLGYADYAKQLAIDHRENYGVGITSDKRVVVLQIISPLTEFCSIPLDIGIQSGGTTTNVYNSPLNGITTNYIYFDYRGFVHLPDSSLDSRLGLAIVGGGETIGVNFSKTLGNASLIWP
ncbi:prepilin-type N-terminal cleavage/methylation domain-containing protein [Desulfosporosinus sp. Sb-LF]|uniref:pilus assembly FimT family protein n=1 Tax=Desulfosporosinus sp. Sb-LF TaxID=2560027 RepID=UPI00107F54CF|nr:prepilin-type N-terminal cleavage/methylation domain-containing protein [Desulfosporosinus sp. Sb-LF]TGE34191.1 prepilin-type N-terminal cleavage/methylation domain-containing protein [Desulfosporosinus sp. Sb-LF]